MRYSFRRKYINEKGEIGDFYDILPKKLTISNHLRYYEYSQPVGVHETMFKEIKIVPYYKDDFIRTAINAVNNADPIEDSNWRRKIYNRLLKIVDQLWDRKRFHVIAHSSGIDSRILSSIIKDLGFDNLLFVECAGESDLFLEIMKAEGWDSSKYMIFRPELKKGDYFSHSFDLIPDNFNGVSSYPINHFYDAYDRLEKLGYITHDCQFFAAFGCYIEKCFKDFPVEQFFRKDYYYQMHNFKVFGEWIFPWWNILYLKECVQYRGCYDHGRISDRINEILPEKVRRIKKYTTKDLIKRGWRTISDNLLMKLQRRYNQTYYAMKKPMILKPKIEYSNSWGIYCEAMICEQLIKKGYEIK